MNKAVAQLFLHIKLPPISVTEKRAMDFILLMDLGGQEFRQGIAGGRVSIPGWLSFSWKPQMEGLRGRMVGAGGGDSGRGGNGIIWRLYFCHVGWDDSKVGLG